MGQVIRPQWKESRRHRRWKQCGAGCSQYPTPSCQDALLREITDVDHARVCIEACRSRRRKLYVLVPTCLPGKSYSTNENFCRYRRAEEDTPRGPKGVFGLTPGGLALFAPRIHCPDLGQAGTSRKNERGTPRTGILVVFKRVTA